MDAGDATAQNGTAAVAAKALTRTFDDDVEAVRGIDLEISR
jgi:hypothetical protein